jgi:hypothetical protein
MERIVSRHRQHFVHDGASNVDEFSTIITSETSTDPRDNRIGNSSSRSCATHSAIRRKAVVVLGHCVINSLIVVLIVAVAITFLGSICIGLILLVKPLPSALQEPAFVTLPSYAVFHDDPNSFSLQYASNRNGSIHTDDDVFIMDRNFPTPQPTRLPTSASPTKVPIRTTSLTNATAATAVTPTFITNPITSMQNRDGQNTGTVNSSNLIIDSSLKQNTSSKVGFTFNDDGKSINNDDPFGSNIPEGSVDDIVAAAKTPTASNDVTYIDSNSPCTGSDCNKSFMDDVLQNALVTQNIDDTVRGNDDKMASYLVAAHILFISIKNYTSFLLSSYIYIYIYICTCILTETVLPSITYNTGFSYR